MEKYIIITKIIDLKRQRISYQHNKEIKVYLQGETEIVFPLGAEIENFVDMIEMNKRRIESMKHDQELNLNRMCQ